LHQSISFSNNPITGFNQLQGKGKIDNNSSDGKKDIQRSMTPLVVLKSKQWHRAFNNPEKTDSTRQNQGPM
jgi:hypothetical protein